MEYMTNVIITRTGFGKSQEGCETPPLQFLFPFLEFAAMAGRDGGKKITCNVLSSANAQREVGRDTLCGSRK